MQNPEWHKPNHSQRDGPCIICDKAKPDYPTIDATTGFVFCADCWSELKNVHHFLTYPLDDLANWLTAIGQTRENHIGQPI
jgi:hypothetical protein